MSTNTPRIDQLERNLIINGNFDFWQRGTSQTFSSAFDAYGPDRFRVDQGGGTFTTVLSRSTDVPTLLQSGFQSVYSFLYTQTSANNTGVGLSYNVEGFDYQNLHGRKFRLQFWVKSSIAGVYSLSLYNANTLRTYITTYTIASAGTWQKITLDLIGDTIGTWTFDNTRGLGINWQLGTGTGWGASTSTLNQWQTVGSLTTFSTTQTVNLANTVGATFQLAQVMLIPQDFTQAGATTVDVPFQRAGRTIGHELIMAQRYCELILGGQNGAMFGSGGFSTTTQANFFVPFVVTKRIAPTNVTFSAPTTFLIRNGTVNLTPNSMSLGSGGFNGIRIGPSVASGGVTGSWGTIEDAASGAAFILVDAEL